MRSICLYFPKSHGFDSIKKTPVSRLILPLTSQGFFFIVIELMLKTFNGLILF